MKNLFRFLFRVELAQLDSEIRARQALEISVASLQRENEFLREHYEEAVRNERYALRFQANISMQSSYGIKPYTETPGLPTRETADKKPEMSPISGQGVEIHRNAVDGALKDYDRRKAAGENMSMSRDHLEALVGGIGRL